MGSMIMGEEPTTNEEPKTYEELRHSPRLECTGIAGVQKLPAENGPCPARIVNLSLGGCLMELQRPLCLALDEMVELIFNVNHLPFHVRGKVRAIRSEKLVGFQFPQLNERVRRQLHDLVGELIEHLSKLHRESLVKHPHEAAAPAGHSAGAYHPIKPAGGPQGDAVHHPAQHGRWF
jgi:hypothetical protein